MPKEKNETKTNEGLMPKQIELLSNLLALDFKAMTEVEETNAGTIVLYLDRAITQSPNFFNKALDKLYQPNVTEEKQARNLKIISSLKKINALCFNSKIQSLSSLGALDQYLRPLGPFNANIAYLFIKKKVLDKINEIKKKQGAIFISTEKRERIEFESHITPQCNWRTLLDLPLEQRHVYTLEMAVRDLAKPGLVRMNRLVELKEQKIQEIVNNKSLALLLSVIYWQRISLMLTTIVLNGPFTSLFVSLSSSEPLVARGATDKGRNFSNPACFFQPLDEKKFPISLAFFPSENIKALVQTGKLTERQVFLLNPKQIEKIDHGKQDEVLAEVYGFNEQTPLKLTRK